MTSISRTKGSLYKHSCGAVSILKHDADLRTDEVTLELVDGCGDEHPAGFNCKSGRSWCYTLDGYWAGEEGNIDFPLHIQREIQP